MRTECASGGEGERSPDAERRNAQRVEATLRDGTRVTIRPIGPDDAQREQAFVRGLSPESRYFRFMTTLRELSPEMLDRFTHPDPAREVALVGFEATTTPEDPRVRRVSKSLA